MESFLIPVYAIILGFIAMIIQQATIFWQARKIKHTNRKHQLVLERVKRENSIGYLAERIEEYKLRIKLIERKFKLLEHGTGGKRKKG